MKKTNTILISLFILTFTSLPAVQASYAKTNETIESIAAKINQEIILASEVNRQIKRLATRLSSQGKPLPPFQQLKTQVLDNMILKKIQLQSAKQLGIEVSDTDLQQTLQNMAQQNGMNLLQFHSTLESEGENFDLFAEEIRQQITIQKLQQRVIRDRVAISELEIKNEITLLEKEGAFAPEYRIGHILLPIKNIQNAQEVAQAQNRATSIIKALRNSASFYNMAVAYSEGQQATQGGTIEWKKPENIPTKILATLQTMEIGEIADPIYNDNAFHVVKLLSVRGGQHHVVTQFQLRHILKKTNEITTDDDIRIELTEVFRQLQKNANFADLAKLHSDDLTNNHKGGDLGWQQLKDLVPEFAQQIRQLKPGQISPPFRTRYGWHIVQVQNNRQKDITQSHKKEQAKQRIFQRKFDEELQTWLRQIRDEAFVQIDV